MIIFKKSPLRSRRRRAWLGRWKAVRAFDERPIDAYPCSDSQIYEHRIDKPEEAFTTGRPRRVALVCSQSKTEGNIISWILLHAEQGLPSWVIKRTRKEYVFLSEIKGLESMCAWDRLACHSDQPESVLQNCKHHHVFVTLGAITFLPEWKPSGFGQFGVAK